MENVVNFVCRQELQSVRLRTDCGKNDERPQVSSGQLTTFHMETDVFCVKEDLVADVERVRTMFAIVVPTLRLLCGLEFFR